MYDFYDAYFFNSGRNKDGEKKALIDKNITNIKLFYQLLDIVMSRFIYKLPDTMDSRFLELCLLNTGQAIITEKDGEVINLQTIGGSFFDRYGYPSYLEGIDFMGRNYGRFIPDTPSNSGFSDAVLIRDSDRNTPAIYRIIWYTNRLTEIQTSISAAISNLRGSTIISCTREQGRAVKRAFMNAGNGIPVIFDFGMNQGGYQIKPEVLTNPQTPSILTTLQEAYDKTLSEFYLEFGINTNNVINKLSGVSDEELTQTKQATDIVIKNALYHRRDALNRASEKYGGVFDVKLAFSDVPRETLDDEGEEDEGGEDDV